ncbi:MAG: type II toxin-antitoxin system HicB family antitoxin [bacterium]
MDFLVVLEKDEDSGDFVADVPELPGCHTQGRNKKEALANIREAIELYLEVKGAPTRREVTIEHVTVEA